MYNQARENNITQIIRVKTVDVNHFFPTLTKKNNKKQTPVIYVTKCTDEYTI